MFADALHAIRALFHNAAAADADVRIAHHLVLRRVPVLEEQEIKPPDFIRTVVRAVARAHAAVVNHVIQAFGAMDRRSDRAHQFARRIFTVHTRNRLKVGFGIIAVALVIRIHPQPVHVTAETHLLFANDCNVVFRLTRDDAIVATNTRV